MSERPAQASTYEPAGEPAPRKGVALFATLLLLMAVASAYMVAVIAVRLDRVFFPGNEIALPQAFKSAPGLNVAVVSSSMTTTPVESISGRINILVLGLDRRPSEGGEPTRSDSMFIVTLDPTTKTGGVLSIPRDLWVELPDGRGGYFEDRINTAYRYGATTNYKGGPLQAARDAVEHNFPQIRVDYEVVIDFTSFISIIDALGGVDIEITEGFRYLERVSVDDRDGVLPVFRIGWEHMTGERALYYSRFRDGPDGDFGRIRRQQQVMVAVAERLLSLDAVGRAPDLWTRFRGSIDTDIPSYRIPGIALLAKQIGLDRVTMRSLSEVVEDAWTLGGAEVLIADPDGVARVVGELFYDARLRQEAAFVEVQNSTTRAGLARTAAGYFAHRGLRQAAVSVSSNAPALQEETTILSYHGKDYTAERLAEWLGVPRTRVRAMRGAAPAADGPDIVVVLGRDAKIPTVTSPTTPQALR